MLDLSIFQKSNPDIVSGNSGKKLTVGRTTDGVLQYSDLFDKFKQSKKKENHEKFWN